jgi:hypothetical protein
MTKPLLGLLFLGLSITTANAIDMKDLAPCRPAAARMCDRIVRLREAGLSTTRRHGSAVLHVISPLGSALLNGGQRPHDAAVAPT